MCVFYGFQTLRTLTMITLKNNKLVEYHVCRVLFELTSSPFLLSATLIKHIKKYEKDYPTVVNELLQSLHVDDLNSGKQTEQEAYDFYFHAKD